MNKLIVFLTFIFCCLAPGIIFGQNYSYRFDYLNTEHGLSDNNVNCIYQDKTGYIWIGTANGLNRYDGKEIVIFRSQNNDKNSLPHNYIQSIAEDRNHNIWIGTWNGLACFNPAKKLFQRFELNGSDSMSASSVIIHKVICAADGKIYVGASNGFFVSDEQGKSFRAIEAPQNYRNTGMWQAVAQYGMEEDTVNKGIWLSSGSFMLFYDYAHQRYYHHYFNPLKWPLFNDVMNSHYTIDRKNNLWGVVSKYRSIIKYNLHTHTLQKFPIEGTFFENSFVTVRMDEKGKLWIGTWNGFPFLFDTKTLQLDSSLFTNPSDKPLSSGRISCLITDRERNLWVGTSKGVSVFKPRYNPFDIFTVNQPEITHKDVKILHLYPESDSVAWVGTSNGLYYYNLLNHSRRNFLPGNITGNTMFYNIAPRNKNELWIGTGNGLLSFNKTTHRFSKAPQPIADATNLDSAHVQVVLYDTDSTLWISTWYHGLYRMNKDFKNIIHYSTFGNVSVKNIVCNYYDD
ncbi:MAG: hypothetical protein JJE25_05670, partial [Bacteroidia bacterium]|nr:hypothetical protein [Bacteroidia bacterium]